MPPWCRSGPWVVVATVSAFLTVGSQCETMECVAHSSPALNPVRKGLVSKPGQWRWSSHNNFSLNLGVCGIQVGYVGLSEQYRV